MKRSYCGLIIVLFWVFSCRNKQHVGTIVAKEEITIPTNSIDQAKFSEIFDSVEYIPLRSGYFTDLRKMRIHNNHIYISSTTPAVLWRYSMDGILVDSLYRQGHGPGEYSNIRDFDIADNGDLYILSRTEKMILIYDNNLYPKHQFTIPVFATGIEILSKNQVMLYCANENILTGDQVIIFDWGQSTIKSGYFPMDMEQRTFINVIDRQNFFERNDTLYFTRGFDNTIYRKMNAEINPWLTVNFGENNLPQSFLDAEYENVMDFYETIRKTDFAFRIIGWTMSDDFALFNFEMSNQFYLAVVDFENDQSKVYEILEDDMQFLGSQFKNLVEIGPYAVDKNGYFYFFINAGSVELKIPTQAMVSGQKESSYHTNSYILRCRLKK